MNTKKLIFTLLSVCFTCISGHAAIYVNEVNSTGKWIELYNSGESAVNVSGYYVYRYNNDGASTAIIPTGTVIAAKGFLALYQGDAASSPVDGAIACLPYGISSAKFMNIVLRNASGNLVDDTFDVGNPQTVTVSRGRSWARQTDGASKIVALDPTPGKSNTAPPSYSGYKIYINEINSTGKWIELYNSENVGINIGGYIITRNNNDEATKIVSIPAGTVIAAKSFLVLYQGSAVPSPVAGAIDCLSFGISSTKFENATLKDTKGNIVDNTFDIGDPQTATVSKDLSWARKTDGGDEIVALNPTPKKSNASPMSFSGLKIYINEVNTKGEWIELYNDENEGINVGGYIITRTNNNEVASIAAIPAGTVIASKGYLVLYQGPDNEGTSPLPVAGAIDCLPFGISLTKFECMVLRDTEGSIVDNTFDIGDPQRVTITEEQSWAREPDGSSVIGAQAPSPGAPNEQGSSISEIMAENALVFVYAGMLNLPENTYYIQLYGISGNLVLSRDVTETSVDLTHLPKGVYLIKLTTSDMLYIRKIIL